MFQILPIIQLEWSTCLGWSCIMMYLPSNTSARQFDYVIFGSLYPRVFISISLSNGRLKMLLGWSIQQGIRIVNNNEPLKKKNIVDNIESECLVSWWIHSILSFYAIPDHVLIRFFCRWCCDAFVVWSSWNTNYSCKLRLFSPPEKYPFLSFLWINFWGHLPISWIRFACQWVGNWDISHGNDVDP